MRAPLREAAGSMAKASTPEPFSTSRTSNWVARAGGLPDYIQHVAHDLMEKRGMPESRAIAMAIGIIKNWAHGHVSGGEKRVDPTTVAAAQKALAEWTAMKARHGKLHEQLDPPVWELRAAERTVCERAVERLGAVLEQLGEAGVVMLLRGEALLEHEDGSEERQLGEQLAEMVEHDLATCGVSPSVPLGEGFAASELRDFRGRWRIGGAHHRSSSLTPLLTPARERSSGVSTPARPYAARVASGPSVRRAPSVAAQRYEGGVARPSTAARRELQSRPPVAIDRAGEKIGQGEWSPSATRATHRLMQAPDDQEVKDRIDTEQLHGVRDANGAVVRNVRGEVVYTPERQALHEAIVETLLQGKQEHPGRARAVFTAGGPASGKGGLLKRGSVPIEGRQHAKAELGLDDMVHANPDVIRKMLPEYKALTAAGRRDASSRTHEEASQVAKLLTRVAMGRQHHVLVDTVGDSGEGKFAGKIRAAQRAGYATSVHYATVPVEEAIRRAEHRASPQGSDPGRFVDHGTIVTGHRSVSARYGEVEKIPGIHLQVFDTSGRGEDKLIAQKQPGDESTAIFDSGAFRNFRDKAKG